jgi:predicted ATPase
VEDIHWIDRTSEEFLTTLVERLAGAPIMIVTTLSSRPSRSVARSLVLTQITLRPLTTADSAGSSIRSHKRSGCPKRSQRPLSDKGEGNPFFPRGARTYRR